MFVWESVCGCVCVCVCECVCECVCVYVVYDYTNVYYDIKVIYDTFGVPVNQKAYK